MRKIELREHEDFDADTAILDKVLQSPGKEGFTVDTMRRALNLTDKLKAANGAILLEEDEWLYLNQSVKNFRWGIPHKVILDLCDRVENAEQVQVKQE